MMQLRNAREARGLSQYDLMILTGIKQNRLSLIERGYFLPTERERDSLAGALGMGDLEFNVLTPENIRQRGVG